MRTVILAIVALALAPAALAARPNWAATVATRDDGSHVLGNPAAKVKLTEYVSYTCPHCAHFQQEADAPLRLAYVAPGTVSVQVNHVIRDPVDLTAAMLANCGDPAGFFVRHHIFLQSQQKWLGKLGTASDAQRLRWTSGPMAARMRAIAADFGFYALMAPRGLGRAAADRCLADNAMAQRLVAQTSTAVSHGVTGTPSFAIGGQLLDDAHDWSALQAEIKRRL